MKTFIRLHLGLLVMVLVVPSFQAMAATPVEVTKLTAADAAASDEFGRSLAFDGDTAVIGAFGDDDAGSGSGSAYVFTRSAGIWTQQARLTAADAAAGDSFGFSVTVDGNTAVIGAPADDDDDSDSD